VHLKLFIFEKKMHYLTGVIYGLQNKN